MKQHRLHLGFGLSALLSFALMYAACGGGGENSSGSGTGTMGAGGSAGGSTGSGFGGDIFNTDAGSNQYTSIEIQPPDPVVEVINGAMPGPVNFAAYGVKSGGEKELLSGGAWSFDRIDLGAIDPVSGSVNATGFIGGSGKVTYKLPSMQTGQTTFTVKLRFVNDPDSVGGTLKPIFDGASSDDPAMTLLYPYNNTVFPRGLTGPVMQWNGGNAGDVYYVHAKSPYFEYEGFGTVPPPSRYSFPTATADVWRKLTDSTTGDVAVSIQRYDGATAFKAKTQTWKIAPANLTGFVYYWEVNNGNVVRIKPGAQAPENFLQKPSGVACVACHSVSKDGSRIVASFHGGYSPWGTFEAATGASLFSSNMSSGFQAISPNGSHVLWRHWNDGGFGSTGYLTLSTYDSAVELAQLNPGGGAPSHPSWSGDGKKIAFSVRTDGNGLDFTQSTLWMTDVDLAANTFSNTKMIVANDAGRPTVTFPTFSADSQWIAFERSTQARSRGAQAEIWLSNADGSVQMELKGTNGHPDLVGEQLSASYEPTFMPVAAGGYFWLVVVSERQYGNTLVDTNPNTRRKQLWVSAIDVNPMAGQDPSHPAFWLPGQGLDNQNMRGEWSLEACHKKGETCSAGYECCDGFCKDDGMGGKVCSDNPGTCSLVGEACETAANCCDVTALCVGGFCTSPTPQ